MHFYCRFSSPSTPPAIITPVRTATTLPVTVVSAGMWIAYSVGGGLYGVALAATAMLSVVMLSMAGIVVAGTRTAPSRTALAGWPSYRTRCAPSSRSC